MSYYPDIDKARISARVALTRKAQMRKLIRESGGTLTETDIAVRALDRELQNVALDPEDLEWIEMERRRNDEMRHRNR